MTKYITIALLLFVNIALAQTDKYYVTFVKGQPILKKTNRIIKVGDALLSTDAIIFKDKQSKISCISPGKGRFDISAQKTAAASKGELLAILKSNLVPATTSYHLSTRSLSVEGYDPKTYFQSPNTNDRILLIAKEILPINPSYKLDESHFFFLQYLQNGKTITKKINQNEMGLLFDKDLFKDGNPEKVTLCYQALIAGKASSNAIVSFKPVLVNKEDLINEVRIIKQNLNDKKLVKDAVIAHIYDNYGKLDPNQIEKLML